MKFVIDCDTGHDDALAILLAARHLDLLGLTTVFGTSTVANTTQNTLRLLSFAGIDLPVHAGCAGPLIGTHTPSPTHGATGLDGADLPFCDSKVQDSHAVDYLIETAGRHRGNVTVIATAPLTNLAIAIRKEPRIVEWLSEISIMGGSAGTGNRTAAAEANFVSDPEAAAIVLSSGIPCRLAGYDITRTFGLDRGQLDALAASGKAVAGVVAGFQGFYLARQIEKFGLRHAPVHDCCAVLPYVAPGVIQYKKSTVRIELSGLLTRGMSVFDHRGSKDPEGYPVDLAIGVDGEKALGALLDAIMSYP